MLNIPEYPISFKFFGCVCFSLVKFNIVLFVLLLFYVPKVSLGAWVLRICQCIQYICAS
jgi:hypothetical protein